MNRLQKTRLRAAAAIHEKLQRRRSSRLTHYLTRIPWPALERLSRQFEQAQRRNWRHAAERLRHQLAWQANRCRSDLDHLIELLERSSQPPVASVAELYRDIASLDEEFEDVECKLKQRELVVTTEPIELEGIELGRFSIVLNWSELETTGAYSVLALEPNPPEHDSAVTHPHVRDEYLCEGQGQAAIRSALDQGRLADFFLLVLRVLKSYAAHSAYVPLDHWSSQECADCGGRVSPGETSACNTCEAVLCDACHYACHHCSLGHCSACLVRCRGCGDLYCTGCLGTCPRCRQPCCHDCLEQQCCQTCHQQSSSREANCDATQEPLTAPAGVDEAE